jgi:hypothetical protein
MRANTLSDVLSHSVIIETLQPSSDPNPGSLASTSYNSAWPLNACELLADASRAPATLRSSGLNWLVDRLIRAAFSGSEPTCVVVHQSVS